MPASWMCMFPTFSISEKTPKRATKNSGLLDVHKKKMTQETYPVLTCFHFIKRRFQSAVETKWTQSVRKRCCSFTHFTTESCIAWLDGWLRLDEYINATYQISYKPPALRAIVTSSLPYFSSADALDRNHNRPAEPHGPVVKISHACPLFQEIH